MMRIIDITGPDGNAFALMGLATSWCKQLGWDSKQLLEDMQSSDYEHLLDVFEEKFKDICKLDRGQDE